MQTEVKPGFSALQLRVRDNEGHYRPLFRPKGQNLFSFCALDMDAAKILQKDPLRRVYMVPDLSNHFENEMANLTAKPMDAEDAASIVNAVVGIASNMPIDRNAVLEPIVYRIDSDKPYYKSAGDGSVQDSYMYLSLHARVLNSMGVDGAVAVSRHSMVVVISSMFMDRTDEVLRGVKSAIRDAFGEWESLREDRL